MRSTRVHLFVLYQLSFLFVGVLKLLCYGNDCDRRQRLATQRFGFEQATCQDPVVGGCLVFAFAVVYSFSVRLQCGKHHEENASSSVRIYFRPAGFLTIFFRLLLLLPLALPMLDVGARATEAIPGAAKLDCW